jgi:predicted RNA-binding Zn-ribbon protein involved in translation (DUF1610 family)
VAVAYDHRISVCPSCAGEIVREVSTCPSCGAVLPLELAVQEVRDASLRKLAPILASIRTEPVSVLAWVLGIIPFLVMPPALAIVVVLYSGKPKGDQRRWLYTVAVVNILLSLYFWSWAGDYLIELRASFFDWLSPPWMPQPKPHGLTI